MTLTEYLASEIATLESLADADDRFLAGYYGALINVLEFVQGPTTETEIN